MKDIAKVAVIYGSDSDLPVMSKALEFFDEMGIEYYTTIVSAHRTPKKLYEFAQNAVKDGFKVIIAGAGGSAHLPGMIASLTPLPVIGVPVKSKSLSGVDSLYSIVQMPPGIPVATVAIDGALNAAILAASILGTNDSIILEKVVKYKESLEAVVNQKCEKLDKIGYNKYIKEC